MVLAVWAEMAFCGLIADPVVTAIAKKFSIKTSNHSEYTKFTKYSSFCVAVPAVIAIQNNHLHPVFITSAVLNVLILSSSLLFHWGHAGYHSLATAKVRAAHM